MFRGTLSRKCISENSQTQVTFNVGENFKTEVCVRTPFPQQTMSWVNDVEMERSIDDLMTSLSIEGKSFLDFKSARCEDCVYVEKDHLQYIFPKESQC